MSDADLARVTELHEGFIKANTHEDTDYLAACSLPDVTWFNLNKSNYMNQEEILTLWRALYDARVDKTKDARLTVSDREVTVEGTAAWVVYLIDVEYEFGDFGGFPNHARITEIWRKVEGDWKLAHFHCSEHVPGIMGGR